MSYFKSQIPNPKSQTNPKSQFPKFQTVVFRSLVIGTLVLIWNLVLGAWNLNGFCQETRPSSGELIVKSWEAHGKKDVEETNKFTQQLIDLYQEEADKQQASLRGLPKNRPDIEAVSALNDVATAHFIQGESYRNQGKNQEAIQAFKIVVDRYPLAQAWDPRGWFWVVAKAAQESIDKLEGRTPVKEEPPKKVSQIPTKIVLHDAGKEEVIDYEKYGKFENVGTKDYKYVVNDQEGLIAAAGEGIYPNTLSVRWDPQFKKVQKENRLDGSHWDFVHSPDLQAAFMKWATAPEPQGVKLFYTAFILEKSGLIKHAIKCYYSIVVHFPGSYGWTYWHTPWYVGQAAVAKIKYLTNKYPELGFKLIDADIRILNGYDNEIFNDIAVTNPGRLMKLGFWDRLKAKFIKVPSEKPYPIELQRGKGKVHLVQYENGDWQLMVDGKPFVIRAVTYSPTKVGQSPDEGTQTSWMEDDFNNNGKADGPYEAFVDKNKNNKQDADEPAVGDFRLMKEMGINAIRFYHHPLAVDKEILRDLYQNYGIRVIMGDFLGKYALGSGAPWNPGTDYNNEEQKKNMLDSVIKMVKEYKDEPYILFWILGNENVYGYACNANTYPDEFFKFANEAAKLIKSQDPEHPVAICSGDTLFLDKFGKNASDIDLFGTNAYRGDYGFGRLWQGVKEEAGIPVFITEFGCPAFAEGKTPDEAEQLQADYHRGSWEDIRNNMAFRQGAGNSVGAVVFEWVDEWWKGYEPNVHDTRGLWIGPFPDGYMHEEWLGLASQGDGKSSPFLRQLRKSYFMYKDLWK